VIIEDHQCKTEDDVCAVVKDADVVIAQWAPVKEKAIAAMQRCKGIVRYGIGLDNVDLEAAKRKGIPVRNVPDYCLNEVADHTVALALALQRQVTHVHTLVKSGIWKITPPAPLPPLRHNRVGLIGFGRISRLVAKRFQPFGCSVVAHDRYVDPHIFAAADVEAVPLDELFSTSDIISLHCPLTDETRQIINATSLRTMKPHALLVNTGRGGLVNSNALVEALEQNRLGGAALDVAEEEPMRADHALLRFPNVIVTSHIAWYSNASATELQRRAAQIAGELLSSNT